MFYTQNMVLSSIFHNLSRCGHSGILAYLSSKEFINSIYFIICITILRDKFVSKGLAKGRNTKELRSWFPLSAAFPDGPDPQTSFHSFLSSVPFNQTFYTITFLHPQEHWRIKSSVSSTIISEFIKWPFRGWRRESGFGGSRSSAPLLCPRGSPFLWQGFLLICPVQDPLCPTFHCDGVWVEQRLHFHPRSSGTH